MNADWSYNCDLCPEEDGSIHVEVELTGSAVLDIEESTYDCPGSTDVIDNEIHTFVVNLSYMGPYLTEHFLVVTDEMMSYSDFITWMEALGLSEADMLEGGEEAIDFGDTYYDEPTWHDEWMDFDCDC